MLISLLRLDMRSPEFGAPTQELYPAALDMAEWADGLGFDMVVLSEHHGVEDGFLPSPIALAGCILGRTRSVKLSVSALLLPLYDPLKLAEDLVVLDLASGGRLSITAGIGYRPDEYAMFDVDWARRGELLDEGIEVLIQAWKGEPFEYQGRTVQITPKPLTGPLPPVLCGGQSKRGAKRAARFGLPYQPATNDADMIALYLSECERLGVTADIRPPGKAQMIWVSEDPDATWKEIGPHLLHDARTYAGWQPASQRSAVHSDATTVEELRAEEKYLVLTPEQCIERSKEPIAVFNHFPLCGGTPPEIAWKSLRLYEEAMRGRT